ncbi:cytoplasmic protein [Phyllobacterium zundukense]|jgi:hypothetical protein|uniref:Cytoplasmic protein n=1 Tax=Phyllobacterium zundukense TaxID=1867719 RepID=A0ACD4D4X1_9HYPH|nr:cytoplasmic protein [Phyllobacterium zundukense]UXN60790.1 cytoplasmic protein [Phyllobacterium zundukense]
MWAIDWTKQRSAFIAAKDKHANEARQRLVLQILCNADLDGLIAQDHETKSQTCKRLKRLIERERLKGVKGHWSYDLNRHIGLKQALDTLKSSMREDTVSQ